MSESTALPLLRRVREILTARLPYCSGTLELSPGDFELYYGQEDAKYGAFRSSSFVSNSSLPKLE